MRKKISREELLSIAELRDGSLYWTQPTKGRRIQGARAGYINKVSGAITIEINGKLYHLNHLVWLIEKGGYPKYKLEHINDNKLNARIENLREIKPRSTVVTAELIRELFDYVDGHLVWKKRLSARSQTEIGSIAGYIGNIKDSEYRYIKIGGTRYKAADLIWAYHKGEMPKLIIDHENHIKSDDNIGNLREATSRQNAQNQSLRVTNKSGVTGVNEINGRWKARISGSDGERIYLGTYACYDKAVIARKAAEKALGYHENHGKKSVI